MIRKKLIGLGVAVALSAVFTTTALADTDTATETGETVQTTSETKKKPKRAAKLTEKETTNDTENNTTMENCGAYIYEWRPVDCGNGRYFVILVGGNTINERDVILRRGFDYGYTFYPSLYPRNWGEVPALVNVDGVWGIPENQALLPEGTQSALTITLVTNNNNLPFKERYIDVVYLPGNVSTASLPAEVRKYLINVDGSDAGAYDGTETAGWVVEEDGTQRYRKADGTFVTGCWLNIEEESYYLDENGIMLTDTMSPDGYYINSSGLKTQYIPGWMENERGKKYVLKNGYYAASTWVTDTDGKSYYFDIGGYLVTNDTTPDGYYVGEDGAWDGNPTTIEVDYTKFGPAGPIEEEAVAYWVKIDGNWKYCIDDGVYLTNGWAQDADGNWYYLDADGNMLTSQMTPDGYYVDEDGVWTDAPAETAEEETAEESTAEETTEETTSDTDSSVAAE